MFALGLLVGLASGLAAAFALTILGYRCAQAWHQQDDDA